MMYLIDVYFRCVLLERAGGGCLSTCGERYVTQPTHPCLSVAPPSPRMRPTADAGGDPRTNLLTHYTPESATKVALLSPCAPCVPSVHLLRLCLLCDQILASSLFEEDKKKRRWRRR